MDISSKTGAQNIASAKYKCGSWQFGSHLEHNPDNCGTELATNATVAIIENQNTDHFGSRIQLNMPVFFMTLGYHSTLLSSLQVIPRPTKDTYR